MKHPESNLQQACVKWFRLLYREPDYLICSIPNGGNRNVVTASILKAEGARAGIPDLMIITKQKIFFVEMKASKGILSARQNEIHTILQNMGFHVYICKCFDEFKKTIEHEISRR